MADKDSQYNTDALNIRSCTSKDEDGAITVCLKTGDSGNDGTMFYNDPKVLGYRYVSPYIHLSPDLAFVLTDSTGNIYGYVLAALDSYSFYQRYINEWLPKMKQLYPVIPSSDDRSKRDWGVIEGFHNDNLQSMKLFNDYPSHLHIDLLPKAQAKGYGKKMIYHMESELKRYGSKGVHLEMAANNDRAFGFYMKLGFAILDRNENAIWLGKKLTT